MNPKDQEPQLEIAERMNYDVEVPKVPTNDMSQKGIPEVSRLSSSRKYNTGS